MRAGGTKAPRSWGTGDDLGASVGGGFGKPIEEPPVRRTRRGDAGDGNAVSEEQPHLHGMGTTATVVGILGAQLLLSQVGDSRAYLIRDGAALQMTRDQSFLQHLLDTGRVSEEQAEEMAPRNVILQALGPSPTVEVVQHWQPILRGDMVLLCSDGLSGVVSAGDIADIVTSTEALPKACQKLIDLANERGGPDNITVILARMTGEGLMAPEDVEGRG